MKKANGLTALENELLKALSDMVAAVTGATDQFYEEVEEANAAIQKGANKMSRHAHKGVRKEA